MPKFETPTNEKKEIKKSVVFYVTNHVVPAQHSKWRLDPKRYSTWTKLTRGTARIKRFLYNSQLLNEHRDNGEFSADEISDAETPLIRSSQEDHFAEEYNSLSKEKEIQSNLIKIDYYV